MVWDTGPFGSGSVTVAGELLVLMKESGELVLAEASSDGFVPVASAQLLPATVRAYPAIADGHLFVRNNDTLLAVDLMR